MNFYTVSAKLLKAMDKDRDFMRSARTEEHWLTDEQIDDVVERRHLREYERTVQLGLKLMLRFKELSQEYVTEMGRMWWTIRPRPHHAFTFNDFRTDMNRLMGRKCFTDWVLTFEQKGTSLETLGEGFHAHVLVTVRQRSIGELKRDVMSTLARWFEYDLIVWDIGFKAVRVKTAKDELDRMNYIEHYTSKDGHKEVTREWDGLWRETEDIAPLYRGVSLLPS